MGEIDSVVYTRYPYRIFLLGKERIAHTKHTAPVCVCVWGGGVGMLLLVLCARNVFNFVLSKNAAGGFWGPRRLVAEMLLYIEIDLA